MSAESEKIALLNDLMRKHRLGRWLITPGVDALSDQEAIIQKVSQFDTFPPGDNPYGQRDFGAFDHNGNRILWKIDYYAPPVGHPDNLEYGSEDPGDLEKTVRVLTIMLSHEY